LRQGFILATGSWILDSASQLPTPNKRTIMIRAFLAIPLSDEVLSRVIKIRDRLAAEVPGVRWVTPETMHLTLRFFGDVSEESLEKIGDVVLSVGRLHPPFPLRIRGVGAFPSAARPRVFWLGVDGAPLAALYAAFEEALEDAGFPREERPFSPHLTLGRNRDRRIRVRADFDKYREADGGILQVDSVVLYESRLRPGGAVHLPRKTVHLGR
jgi:RNA 2',3'-cyclic 3'-phosphodiesterase